VFVSEKTRQDASFTSEDGFAGGGRADSDVVAAAAAEKVTTLI